MTQEQFVRSMAEAYGISIKQAREEVSRVLEHIRTVVPTLQDGEKLNLTGTLQFEVSDVPARLARNPKTGEQVQKEATRKVKVRPMASLKSAVKGQ
jgi:DNA-binding protein HU-beta